MAQMSGKNGAVDGFATVRNWNATYQDDGPNFVGSGMGGLQASLAGNKDWTAGLELYGHSPAYMPGDTLTFAGYNGAKRFTGSAIVVSFTLSVNIEAGGVIGHSLSIGGNGAYSIDGTSVSDTDPPEAYSSLGCKVTTDDNDDGTFIELANVSSYTLTFQAEMDVYSDSSTSGVKKREAKIITGSASVTVNQSDLTVLPTPGTLTKVRFYVSSTEYWQVGYMRVVSVESPTDIEGGGLGKVTINLQFSSFKRVSGTMTAGSIIKPNLDAWVP